MKQKIRTIANSCLIVVLIALVSVMMVQIERLQGTARVINYAGLVRGATQREVKLEIAGHHNDILIQYLDDILSGLKYADGHYDLVSLDDADYQEKLAVQMAYWQQLKEEISDVRQTDFKNTRIVSMSETYFSMADDTVSAAENYSQKIATELRWLEVFSIADMAGLVFMLLWQTLDAVRIAKANKILEKRAYLDLHTGLPNKSRCEEILLNADFIENPTALIMLDLNNLKKVNDSYGHSAGDQMILHFAQILQTVVSQKDFVGRYGGDEFIIVLQNSTQEQVEGLLQALAAETERFNASEDKITLSYAHGYALSTDHTHCTMQLLFDCADQHMYENKQKDKRRRCD